MNKNSNKDAAETANQAHQLPDVLDNNIPYQINRLGHRINRRLEVDLQRIGLSVSAWRVLAVLDFNASVSVNELARFVMIEQSTLSRLLQRMEADGLIDRGTSRRDGRFREIRLTALGQSEYEKAREIALKHIGQIVDGFSSVEQAQFLSFVKRLQGNVENR